MTDVTVARVGELLRSVLELLWNKPDGIPAQDLLAYIPQVTELTDYEKGYAPPANVPRYERIVRLATIPMVQAGWLTKSTKGRWFITEEGRRACRRFKSAQELYTEALDHLELARQGNPSHALTVEQAEEKAWDGIQRYLQTAQRASLQSMVADLMKAMGYFVAWIAPPEKDRGRIDLVAYTDPIGAKAPRILVQLHHKGQPVAMEGLKSFLSAVGDGDYGLLISTGGFTAEASDAMRNEGFKRTTLLDLEGFFDLWVLHYDRLSEEARSRFPLTKIYFLSGMI